MDAVKQEALRQYLIGWATKLKISPPRGQRPEQLIAHYAQLNGQAIAVLEHAADELKQ